MSFLPVIDIFLSECSRSLKLYLLRVLQWPKSYVISMYKTVMHLKSGGKGIFLGLDESA